MAQKHHNPKNGGKDAAEDRFGRPNGL